MNNLQTISVISCQNYYW